MRRFDARLRAITKALPHQPPDGLSIDERNAIIRAVFDEYMAIQGGEQVTRVHTVRTDLSALTVRLIHRLAHAIQAPIEDVLPNLEQRQPG